MTGYLCIGGPADGEYMWRACGCHHLKVCELLAPATMPYSKESELEPFMTQNFKDHNYYLAASKRHGFVWVHEDYKGIVQ